MNAMQSRPNTSDAARGSRNWLSHCCPPSRSESGASLRAEPVGIDQRRHEPVDHVRQQRVLAEDARRLQRLAHARLLRHGHQQAEQREHEATAEQRE